MVGESFVSHQKIGTPELTVAMVASGKAPLVETLRSLSHQTDVACEILVVDDGVVESTELREMAEGDRRIRIIRNDRPLGDVASLHRAVGEATGSVVTFVEPGQTLLPGALRILCDAVIDAPDVAMAHAYWAPREFLSRVSRRSLRAHRSALLEHLPPDTNHRSAFAVMGNVVQALPTFRRSALQGNGGLRGATFDEAIFAAAVNALVHAEARIVPKILCATASPRTRGWRLRRHPRPISAMVRDYPGGWNHRVRRGWMRFGEWARSAPPTRALLHVRRPYEILGDSLPQSAFPLLRGRKPSRTIDQPRVAYVLWRYPALSETFIRREIQALRESGLPLEVVALEPDDPPIVPDAASPAGPATYYGATDDTAARAFLRQCLRRNPITVTRLWLWLVGHHYHPHKTWWRDRNTLFDAAHLALALRKLGVTHVHSPWADQTATRSSVAARLLGVTFSVQARAAEIHKTTEPLPVLERLRTAKFIITNSVYNEKYLGGLLRDVSAPKLSVIYNGVDLPRFEPVTERTTVDRRWRLLCVARLAEFKGLPHLLRVCRSLRDDGVNFACDIIGGPEEGVYTAAWVQLRKLHTELDLARCVHFRGAQPFSVVLGALREADLFVLPCVHARDGAHDITPNALIEAMAMALPVISTTTGAIPEIVDHDVNGLLVPPGDEPALLAAIERLLGDDDLRWKLGRAARRKIEERFDIARNVEQRMALFRSL